MLSGEQIDRRRQTTFGLHSKERCRSGGLASGIQSHIVHILLSIKTFLMQKHRSPWRTPSGFAGDHIQQDKIRESASLSSSCELLRQAHGGIKLRGWEPSLHASDVLPFVQEFLDDRLRIMGIEACLALISLEHVEHVGVVLVLSLCHYNARCRSTRTLRTLQIQ